MEFSRGELSLAHIDLDLAIASGLPEVAADENQIRQALLNLVRNAKEAMPRAPYRVQWAPSTQVGFDWRLATAGRHQPGEPEQDFRSLLLHQGKGHRSGTGSGATDRE